MVAFEPVTGEEQKSTLLFDYLEKQIGILDIKYVSGKNHKYPYLVCGTKSVRKSKVLLQAHMDVVPAETEQFALRIDGNKLYGRGVYDMLFAAAIYLCLARELHSQNLLHNLDVGFMFTSDEEIGGYYGVGELVKDYECELCFIPDAGSSTHSCVTSKGVMQLNIASSGRAGHSSRPRQADNPIIPLANFVTDITARHPNKDEFNTTYVITQFKGGEAINQIPHMAQLTLDIRFQIEDEPKVLLEEVTRLAESYGLTVTVIGQAEAFTNADDSNAIDRFRTSYQEITGQELGELSERGSSDARFFAAKNIPVMMIRPIGGDLHGENEWVDAASLEQFYTILKAYITKEAIL